MEIPIAKVITKNIDVLTHCVIISTLENNENDENNEIEESDINDEDYTVALIPTQGSCLPLVIIFVF